MTQDDFYAFAKLIEKLALATKQKINAKIINYFFDNLCNFPLAKIENVIERFEKNADKFPVLKDILAELTRFEDKTAHLKAFRDCRLCGGVGHLAANDKDGKEAHFRCNECHSWKGLGKDSLPFFGDEWRAKGFRVPLPKFGRFNPNDSGHMWLKKTYPHDYQKWFEEDDQEIEGTKIVDDF